MLCFVVMYVQGRRCVGGGDDDVDGPFRVARVVVDGLRHGGHGCGGQAPAAGGHRRVGARRRLGQTDPARRPARGASPAARRRLSSRGRLQRRRSETPRPCR